MAIDGIQDKDKSGGMSARADMPPAVRREQQNFSVKPDAPDESDDDALNDISTILLGAKATMGKALTSSAQVSRNADSVEAHKVSADNKRAEESRQAQELRNLEAWNAQKTIVGGVEMTNGEAQAARQNIIDNEDYYAERAVREGRIKEGEKEEYKRTIRRIHELKDREGRGIETDADKREGEQLLNSRMGQTTERDVGKDHVASRGYVAKATSDEQSVSTLKSNTATPLDDKLFKSAPILGNHFEAANKATTPLDAPSADVQPSRKLAAMNFAP